MSSAEPLLPPFSQSWAVIQDLPVELIERILDIAIDHYIDFCDTGWECDKYPPSFTDRVSFLLVAALVCRIWGRIAINLLHREMVLSSWPTPLAIAHLHDMEALHDKGIVKRLQLLRDDGDPQLLPQLRSVDLRIEHLRVVDDFGEYEFDDLPFAVSSKSSALRPTPFQADVPLRTVDLQTLILDTTINEAVTPATDFPSLTHLALSLTFETTTHFLAALWQRAPALRALHLKWCNDYSPLDMCYPPLLTLTSRLKHFSIQTCMPQGDPELPHQLRRFLPHLIALTSLGLWDLKVSEVSDLLNLLPSKLALFTVGDVAGEAGIHVYEAFRDALSAPAVSELNRWRFDRYKSSLIDIEEGKIEEGKIEEGKTEFEQACAERGIDLRDFAHRFTGKSSAALIHGKARLTHAPAEQTKSSPIELYRTAEPPHADIADIAIAAVRESSSIELYRTAARRHRHRN